MKRVLLAAIPLVLLGSCGEPPISPLSGTWVFVNGEVLKNTCSDQADVSSGDFTLLNNDDGTFTIDPEDGSDAFLCDLEGDSFTCPERLQQTITPAGTDVKIEIRVSASGSFTSAKAANGQQDGHAACTGTQCAAVATLAGITFPCDVSAKFNASFKP